MTFIEVDKNRIRKDVRCGDLVAKTKNGWYFPVIASDFSGKTIIWGVYDKYGRLIVENKWNRRR